MGNSCGGRNIQQTPHGKPVLEYFDGHGRGTPIRIVLHYCNVDFEDQRISFAKFGWR